MTHTSKDSFCFQNKQARKQNLNKSTFTGKYKELNNSRRDFYNTTKNFKILNSKLFNDM